MLTEEEKAEIKDRIIWCAVTEDISDEDFIAALKDREDVFTALEAAEKRAEDAERDRKSEAQRADGFYLEKKEVEVERDTLRAEVERLRAALANSELPCVYCTLPKDEWAKCASGFPGCDRADDAMCARELRAEVEKWQYAFAAQSRKLEAVLHIPGVKEALASLTKKEAGDGQGSFRCEGEDGNNAFVSTVRFPL